MRDRPKFPYKVTEGFTSAYSHYMGWMEREGYGSSGMGGLVKEGILAFLPRGQKASGWMEVDNRGIAMRRKDENRKIRLTPKYETKRAIPPPRT